MKEPRALSLLEVRRIGREEDLDRRDIVAVALAYSMTEAEALDWLGSVPAGEALAAIEAVWVASGLAEDATKSS